MKLYDNFYEKNLQEIQQFRKSFETKTSKEVYSEFYKIHFYEAFFGMLSSNFMNNHDEIIEWLYKKEEALEYLYIVWLECDNPFTENWDEMLEWLCAIYNDDKNS